ncbi:MAG: hypothetical protein HYY64_11425 [Candidatus Rokubacteria bacterium]|nr:hypothetical protein [Candidatus Rokubacteria bacterium]
MDRKDGLLALAALAVLILFLAQEQRIAGASGLPLDDAWIHLHFARNLAEGAGFSYNPGHPVAGSTAPLWTLLLAAGFLVAGPALWVVKSLGVVLTLATALVARRLARALTRPPHPAPLECPSPFLLSPPGRGRVRGGEGKGEGVGVLAGLAVLGSAGLAWGSLSGMEVPLAAFLVTAALWAHVAAREWAAAILMGLAILARPEALLLAPFLLFSRPLTSGRAVRLLGVVALFLAPAVAFSLATVGAPVPATAAAKVQGGLLGFLLGAREPWTLALVARPWRFLADWTGFLWTQHPLLPFLVPVGLLSLARQGRAVLVPALVLVAHPIGMALLAPYRGPSFQEGRYSTHLVPLAVVVAVVGLSGLLRERRRRWVIGGWLCLALVALWPGSLRYAWAVQNINAMQVHLGEWVTRNLPADARLALNDVGAIAFISRREVVDLMGLVTPEILAYRRAGETGVLRYLEQACPDYLIIFPAWFPRLAALSDRFSPVYRVGLPHNTVAGAAEMVVFETAWSRWGRSRAPCPKT